MSYNDSFCAMVDALFEQGMKKLVINLRGNCGGLDGIGLALGKENNYECISSHNVMPEGKGDYKLEWALSICRSQRSKEASNQNVIVKNQKPLPF